MHNGLAGKALLLTAAWSVAGSATAGWPWWRGLLTLLAASVLGVLVVAGGSGVIDDQRWPTSASARLRSTSSFLVWCAMLLWAAWWMGPTLVFLIVTVAAVVLWTWWAWPASEAPKLEDGSGRVPIAPGVEERVRGLPSKLPQEVAASIDAALEDWQHLNEVLASDPELRAEVEPLQLHDVAQVSLTRLLDAARTTAELSRIASERSDDEYAPVAAQKAHRRLQALERGLHDTTSTLLRYVASREDAEERALRVRVEELEALAEVEEVLSTQVST